MMGQHEFTGATSLSSKAVRSLVTAKLRAAGVDVRDVQARQRDIHIWLSTSDEVAGAEAALDIWFLVNGGLADHRTVFHLVSGRLLSRSRD